MITSLEEMLDLLLKEALDPVMEGGVGPVVKPRIMSMEEALNKSLEEVWISS